MFTKDLLLDKRIVVIGGTSGIGFATALDAHHCGARVAVVGRNDPATEGIQFVARDLYQDNNQEELCKNLQDIFPDGIDIVVYSAGAGLNQGNNVQTENIHNKVLNRSDIFNINFHAMESVLLHLVDVLSVANGAFIYVSSSQTLLQNEQYAWYADSKRQSEKFLLNQQKKYPQIRINWIYPSAIDTSFFKNMFLNENEKEDYIRSLLTGRMGSVQEVSKLILDIATNTYIYGTGIKIDGGRTIMDV